MINIANTSPHAINLETHGIMLELPSEAPGGTVVLPRNPTLHDISQTYVAAYGKLTGRPVPELRIDYWDKGLTRSGMDDVMQAVCSDALRDLSPSRQKSALSLLDEWYAVLNEKLQKLETTDGCSGCFDRHENSRAVRRHIFRIAAETRQRKGASFLRAARRMDLAALQEWIADGMDVNTRVDYGNTALIDVLMNEAPDPETRRKIDECAFYLLSLPGIDPHQQYRNGNAFGAALRAGHESIAEYLIKTYPRIVLDNGLGATLINTAARRCPKVLEQLKRRMLSAGGRSTRDTLDLYTLEIARVPPQHRAQSRAFYLEVMSGIIEADSSLGHGPMEALLSAAIAMNDPDMREAAAQYLAQHIPDPGDLDAVPALQTEERSVP
jgi:hypothetical protein